MSVTWSSLNRRIVHCTRCPRLREHCAKVGREKRKAFADWDYWARPVPNLGRADARILIVGLAPAAHGANRTGRMFTGDRSGDFLYSAMHAAGLASQPTATHRDDGLELIDCAITAAAHCAPPANKPTGEELDRCSAHLDATIDLLADLRVIVCLGRIGHDQTLRRLKRRWWVDKLADHPFAHGAEHAISPDLALLDTFHPSQQNTFTGRLTRRMLTAVLRTAIERADTAEKRRR
jgi:uracil-DNA glycosylase family 4